MLLTEEEKCTKGFSILKQFQADADIKKVFNENVNIPPSYTDYAVTAIIIEHINEHYRELTLNESTWQVSNNVFINGELYSELYEMLLNENPLAMAAMSVARVIGGAVNRTAVNTATNIAKNSVSKAVGKKMNAVNLRTDFEASKSAGEYGNDIPGFLQKSGSAIKTNYAEWAAKNAENKALNDKIAVDVLQGKDLSLQDKIDYLKRDPVSALAKSGVKAVGKHMINKSIYTKTVMSDNKSNTQPPNSQPQDPQNDYVNNLKKQNDDELTKLKNKNTQPDYSTTNAYR